MLKALKNTYKRLNTLKSIESAIFGLGSENRGFWDLARWGALPSKGPQKYPLPMKVKNAKNRVFCGTF